MINISLLSIILLAFILAIYVLAINSNIFIKFFAIIFIFITIYSIFTQNLLLPFLGITVYPPSLIPYEMYPPNTNSSINLKFNVPDGSKIIYWAADNYNNHSDFIYDNPIHAYGNYNNSGIAIVNNGIANIKFICPNKYKIPTGITLNKHIHYRIAYHNNPILSPVMTTYIKC
jgi:hypothetical protein